jgi:hypothetical protein
MEGQVVSPIQSPDRRDRSGDWRRCFAERTNPLRSFSCFLIAKQLAKHGAIGNLHEIAQTSPAEKFLK